MSAADTARRLIARHGAAIKLTTTPAGTYDPTTQRTVTPAPVITETRGVVAAGNETKDGGGLSTRRFYLAGYAEPKEGDAMTFAGATYRVGDVLPIYAGGIVAVYDVRVARA